MHVAQTRNGTPRVSLVATHYVCANVPSPPLASASPTKAIVDGSGTAVIATGTFDNCGKHIYLGVRLETLALRTKPEFERKTSGESRIEA